MSHIAPIASDVVDDVNNESGLQENPKPQKAVPTGRLPEIGAAWTKKSNEGREYLGLKLDDPGLKAPIYANLFDDEDSESHSLIWSRPSTRRSD